MTLDLLTLQKGTITAPAGCGKTDLIKNAVKEHNGSKPILVLTHTNAGVAAMRERFQRATVSPRSYRLSTIDGWMMRVISSFPKRSGVSQKTLLLQNPKVDYPKIRDLAVKFAASGDIHDVIYSSYARLIVDEYQDCTLPQHSLVTTISALMPTCVLGDPMQSIFGFGKDRVVDWETEVIATFGNAGSLSTPWRWLNADAPDLGNWLLKARETLQAGAKIDLPSAPAEVEWVRLNGDESDGTLRDAAAATAVTNDADRILIIDRSVDRESQRLLAKRTPGAVTVEAVDLTDLINFARGWSIDMEKPLGKLITFGKSVLTGNKLEEEIDGLRQQILNNDSPRTSLQRVSAAFLRKPSYDGAADVLEEMASIFGVREHRPSSYHACVAALRECAAGETEFVDAVIRARELNRVRGRVIPERGVGSTLLLKGLEAEVVVVMYPGEMDNKNLYVAITRGSKKLVVCSNEPLLG